MALISKLKALLGLDAGRRRQGGTTVTVEREVSAETERAVKESPPTDGTMDAAAEASAATDGEPGGSAAEAPPAEEEDDPGTAAEAAGVGSAEPLQSIKGIGPSYAERLEAAGVADAGDLAAADAAELAEATDIAQGRVADWVARARDA